MTEKESFLVPTDVYFKAGVHIGTKFRTKYMQSFIYKIRSDGLAVLNVSQIDKRIRIAAKFLARYAPEDVILVCRRENGWKPLKLFGKYTGCKVFPGRYQPGILTNPKLAKFTEAKVMLVTDAWPDRNAAKDAKTAGLAIIGLCDTNNEANNLDFVIPSNNKGRQALGLIFFLLANEYLKARGLPGIDKQMEEFLAE
ncbi:MAG: 30S ribosomal protein S2 [Nanoarchaeota archaeon]|nr:30S ribosomal protein S2 [Nanoarchaeota archaeon]